MAKIYVCDNCGTKLGEVACSNSNGGSYCSAQCADFDENRASVDGAVLELLTNLTERVHSLERQVDSLSTQLRDTQANVERQGVEIAEISFTVDRVARETKAPQSGATLLAEAFEALAKYERSVRE